MKIRKKTKNERQKELNAVSSFIAHHRITLESLKTDKYTKISKKKIDKIIKPRTDADYKDLLIAMRKYWAILHAEDALQEKDMVIFVTQKTYDDRLLSYCEYGNGDVESLAVKMSRLEKDIQKLTIVVENDKTFKEIILPDTLNRRIISYLKDMNIEQEDCFYFMCHMYWLPQLIKKQPEHYEKYINVRWLYEAFMDDLPFQEEELKMGDAITLTQNGEPKHHAIYLQDWLYVSKLWKNPICFNTIEQLHSIYKTDNVVIERYYFDNPEKYETTPMPQHIKNIAIEAIEKFEKDVKMI